MTVVDPGSEDDNESFKSDKAYKVCGGKTRQEIASPYCTRPAGWGTDHPGFGRCKLHGGMIQDTTKMQAEAALQTYGIPIKTTAIAALEDELWRTAGHVEWLSAVVANLETTVSDRDTEGIFDWQRSANGQLWRQPSVWVQMYQSERKHLIDVAAKLVRLGVDKERLDVIRSSGLKMASVFQAVLGDARLGLTEEQIKVVPDLIREHIATRQIESTT